MLQERLSDVNFDLAETQIRFVCARQHFGNIINQIRTNEHECFKEKFNVDEERKVNQVRK